MKKKSKKFFSLLLILALSFTLMAGCNNAAPPTDGNSGESKGTVKIVNGYWAEGIAMTSLVKVILEDKMGYDVEVTMADMAPIFTSISSGDQDVFLDSWLPVTHQSYMEEYGDNIEDLAVNFEGARFGLVVPSYMDVNSIEELNDIAGEVNNEIIGIDSGAGMMEAVGKAVDAYGLDLTLLPGSGPAMTAALDTAIQNEEPIVVLGWEPHWKFAKYDLKFLEDPQNVLGDAESIHTITRLGFSDDMPEVAEFLKAFKMDSQELGGLMGDIEESDAEPEDAARDWMNNNEDLVQSWLPA